MISTPVFEREAGSVHTRVLDLIPSASTPLLESRVRAVRLRSCCVQSLNPHFLSKAALRRTAERALGHALPAIRGTYDRHDYKAEMLKAFEKLSALISNIVDPTDRVVPMTRTRKR